MEFAWSILMTTDVKLVAFNCWRHVRCSMKSRNNYHASPLLIPLATTEEVFSVQLVLTRRTKSHHRHTPTPVVRGNLLQLTSEASTV